MYKKRTYIFIFSFSNLTKIMSDAEFDALRGELKEDKSSIAVSKEPKCYIEVSCFLVHEFYVCLVSTC